MDCNVGFVGVGSVARIHSYALAALSHYYSESPNAVRVAASSRDPARREAFAKGNGFLRAVGPDAFWEQDDIDAVFILGPNCVHFDHLKRSLSMKNIRRVYLEKPACATREQTDELAALIGGLPPGVTVQVGFQFLQTSVVLRALRIWREGLLGQPIHFHARYLHGSYLDVQYREKRSSRLKPSPEGGANTDLGSHAFSLLAAFLGERLSVVSATSGGSFPDVPPGSDLCTVTLLRDSATGAVGTVVASRVSSGAGELLELELRGSRGFLRFTSERPDVLETSVNGESRHIWCGSDYLPASDFPSRDVASGWLRSYVHAQALFFGHPPGDSFVPDLRHGLAVQKLVNAAAEFIRHSNCRINARHEGI